MTVQHDVYVDFVRSYVEVVKSLSQKSLLQKVNCFQRSNETSDDKHFNWSLIGLITTTFAGKYIFSLASDSAFYQITFGVCYYITFVAGGKQRLQRRSVVGLKWSATRLKTVTVHIHQMSLRHLQLTTLSEYILHFTPLW